MILSRSLMDVYLTFSAIRLTAIKLIFYYVLIFIVRINRTEFNEQSLEVNTVKKDVEAETIQDFFTFIAYNPHSEKRVTSRSYFNTFFFDLDGFCIHKYTVFLINFFGYDERFCGEYWVFFSWTPSVRAKKNPKVYAVFMSKEIKYIFLIWLPVPGI